MCPNTGDHAAEFRNEPDHCSNTELAYCGLDEHCSGVDFDSAELRHCSTGTDSNRAVYSGGREQWRAVANVGNASTEKVRGLR